MRNLRLYFVLFGLLNLSTLLAQFMHYPNVIGFLSLFTILANICATGAFFYMGLNTKERVSIEAESFFGVSVVYMIITALGYWFLLRNVLYPVLLPFANLVFHTIIPIALLLGWFMYKHEHRLDYSKALSWLFFPFIFLIYTLIHGLRVGWYPYPFLDPRLFGGYYQVFIYSAFLSLGFYLSGLIVIWAGNRRLNN